MASRSILPAVLLSCSAVAISAGAAHAAGPGVTLLPHRAVYDLTLGKTSGSGAPATARGRIVYEFSGTPCEGYVTNFRQITEIQMDEGRSRVSDMRSSTYEDGDGSGFRFKTDTFIDNTLVDSIDGRAHKADDGAVSVNVTKPTVRKIDFEPGAYFPTAQMVHIVEEARKGARTAQVKVFDGSDNGQKLFDTMTVIGQGTQNPSAEKAAATADALKGVQHWPVSVSYFDPSKRDGSPNYVLGFDLYENGVSGKLRIDYGSYVLNGEMTKFEILPQKECK